MSLSDEDVREILALIDSSPLRELKVQTDGFSLHVVRGEPGQASTTVVQPGGGGTTVPASTGDGLLRTTGDGLLATTGDEALAIASPMLGTFYRAEGPGAKPFVEVGARVEPDTTVAIIEVMKMMNSIPAGVSGTIVEVCAENAALVEFGETLFRVAPR
jgi:acetyl-CoA carboxylase biotin carboxyl carrier protein